MVNVNNIEVILSHMNKNLDREIIKLGLGKYVERYEHIREALDKKHMIELWNEIKKKQEIEGYFSIYKFKDKLRVDFNEQNFDEKLKTIILDIYMIYAEKLLIRFYPNNGLEFISNELKEYRHSKDPIELFDTYIMTLMYTIAEKIKPEDVKNVLNEINKILIE